MVTKIEEEDWLEEIDLDKTSPRGTAVTATSMPLSRSTSHFGFGSRSRERNELASQVMRNRFPEPRAHHLGRKYTPHAPGQQQGYVQHCELKCLSDTHAIERMAIERRMRHAKPTLRLF